MRIYVYKRKYTICKRTYNIDSIVFHVEHFVRNLQKLYATKNLLHKKAPLSPGAPLLALFEKWPSLATYAFAYDNVGRLIGTNMQCTPGRDTISDKFDDSDGDGKTRNAV